MTKAYLATLPSTNIDHALLNLPDPPCESAVQEEVDDYSQSGEAFCCLEAIFVVQGEGDGSDNDSSVSKTKFDVGIPVRLAELKAVQVVLESIVGRVLAVWGGC